MLLILHRAQPGIKTTDFHTISSVQWCQGHYQPSKHSYLTQDISCHTLSLHCWYYTPSNSLNGKKVGISVSCRGTTARNKLFFWRLFSNPVSPAVGGSVKILSHRPLQILLLTKWQNDGTNATDMEEWWGKTAASQLSWSYSPRSKASWLVRTVHSHNK